MNDSLPPQPSRRLMFGAAGGAVTLAATAALLPAPPAIAPTVVDANASAENAGYQSTPHVLRYYQTARV